MIALLWFVLAILASPFKSKSRLEAENDALKENNRSPAWCFPPLEKRFEFPLGCLKSFAPIQDSNEIPLLERGTNEDVRSRDHREQKMAHGHGWCRPECNDETEIKRVPHEFVE